MYFLKLHGFGHCMYRNVFMVIIVVMKDLLSSQQSKESLRIMKAFEYKASGFIPVLLRGLLGAFSVFTATFFCCLHFLLCLIFTPCGINITWHVWSTYSF